jgi:hypothetical protein
MEAFHNHDCDKCTHLLSTEYLRWAIDVYYCESRDLFGGSLILRLSDDPPDYWSSGLDTLHPGSRSLSYWSPVMRAIVETAGCATPKMIQAFNIWTNDAGRATSAGLAELQDGANTQMLTLLRCSILCLSEKRRNQASEAKNTNTLNAIVARMSGKEWSPDTLNEIAQVLQNAGHTIEDIEDKKDE